MRTFINESGIKADLVEIKLRNGNSNYLITWNNNAIDRKEYKTLSGAIKFLTSKGYTEI